MELNNFLPGEIAIMVLRYLASNGCVSSVMSLISEMPCVKYYVPPKSIGVADATYVNLLGRPSLTTGLKEVLNDYAKSKLLVTELIEREDPGGSPLRNFDSLTTLLQQLKSALEKRDETNLEANAKRSVTIETQTEDMMTIEFTPEELAKVPLMFYNSCISDLTIPQKLADAINEHLPEICSQNESDDTVQKICSQTESEIDKFMQELLKDENEVVASTKGITEYQTIDVSQISSLIQDENFMEEHGDGLRNGNEKLPQSKKPKQDSKTRNRTKLSSKPPVEVDVDVTKRHNIPKKRIRPTPAPITATPRPNPVFEFQDAPPVVPLPTIGPYSVSGVLPTPKCSQWEKLGRRSIAPKVMDLQPTQSTEIGIMTSTLLLSQASLPDQNIIVHQTPTEKLSSYQVKLQKHIVPETTPILDVETPKSIPTTETKSISDNQEPDLVQSGSVSTQKFQPARTQSKSFSTPRKKKHVRSLFLSTTPPSLKYVSTSKCSPELKDLDNSISLPHKRKATEPKSGAGNGKTPKTLPLNQDEADGYNFKQFTKSVSLSLVYQSTANTKLPNISEEQSFNLFTSSTTTNPSPNTTSTSSLIPDRDNETEIDETSDVEIDIISEQDETSQAEKLIFSLKRKEARKKSPAKGKEQNLSVISTEPIKININPQLPTSSSDEDYETKIKKNSHNSKEEKGEQNNPSNIQQTQLEDELSPRIEITLPSPSKSNIHPPAETFTKQTAADALISLSMTTSNLTSISQRNEEKSPMKQITLSTPKKIATTTVDASISSSLQSQTSIRFDYPSDTLTIHSVSGPLPPPTITPSPVNLTTLQIIHPPAVGNPNPSHIPHKKRIIMFTPIKSTTTVATSPVSVPSTPTPRYDFEMDSNSSSNSVFRIKLSEDKALFKGPPPTPGKMLSWDEKSQEALSNYSDRNNKKTNDEAYNTEFQRPVPSSPKPAHSGPINFPVSYLLNQESNCPQVSECQPIQQPENVSLTSRSRKSSATVSEESAHSSRHQASCGTTFSVNESKKCLLMSEEKDVFKAAETVPNTSIQAEFVTLHRKAKQKSSGPAALRNLLQIGDFSQFLKKFAQKHQSSLS